MKSFKYAILIATTVILGFSQCSKHDDTGKVDNSSIAVKVTISALSTYAEEVTAVDKTPDLNELHVFFTDGISINEMGAFTAAEIKDGTKTFIQVPASATTAVLIGNALSQPTAEAITTIAVGDPVSKLSALMFRQKMQTDPVKAVNLHGEAPIVSGEANVSLYPVIARIEIARVEVNPSAIIPLSSFKLAGIYINNTYTACGTDFSTLPTAAEDILNYGSNATVWTNGTYPARFKDEWTNPAAGTFAEPAKPNANWSYYVVPVKAELGTTIDGVVQTSVPHIVLKITDAVATGYAFTPTMFVTIKDIRIDDKSLTNLEKGKVYSIAPLLIGGENLAASPMVSGTQGVTATATVSPWMYESVNPIIP